MIKMPIKIINRSMDIPIPEQTIGYTGDNLVEVRTFELHRMYGNIDLSGFDFRLDTQIGEHENVIYLDKTISDDKITLTWVVDESHIQYPGDMTIQIRAFNAVGVEKWHTDPVTVKVKKAINALSSLPSPLPSEFNEMEARVAQKHNEVMEAAEQVAEDKAEVAENLATVLTKAQEAAESAANALQSEINAKTSEDNAKDYADEAERQAEIAANNILNGVATHNADEESHPYVLSEMVRIESIARGKASAKVFDTAEEMNDWLSDPDNVETLKIGDNLYIRDINVPDYWWDGEHPQILEAQAINLSDYYTKQEVDARLPIVIEQSDYDELVDSGQVIAGRIYYVVPDGALGDSDD